MDAKQKEEESLKLKVFCSTCGKPIADKAATDVTRFLAFESRCTCADPNQVQPRITASPLENPKQSLEPDEQTLYPEERAKIEENLGERYEVQSLLGRGGMGAVYKVKDKQLDKTFAIKVLNQQLVTDQSAVKRFEQEARAASSLTQANLAAVYDYGIGRTGSPFIVMDYLDGSTLSDILAKEGFLDQPRALEIFIQTAEAVAHAHSKGVIHRDIKPSNIIIEDGAAGTDFVKLVDFGIAKVLPTDAQRTKMTQTGEIFGSPLYMSPEQCLGNKLDARSDIYEMGCVMYEALTGAAPFSAENPIKTILRHINGKDADSSSSDGQRRYSLPLAGGWTSFEAAW